MTDIPHFDFPFNFDRGSFSEVEQDSLDEIITCVEAALLTQIGWRKELPTFGTDDMTFDTQPIDLRVVTEQIALHEPRVDILMQQHPDKLDELVARVIFNVSGRGEESLL